MIYSGRCRGGPLDGQMLAHYSKTLIYFSPVSPFSLNESQPVVPMKVGEYHISRFNQWYWTPTLEGKALKTLSEASS